MVIFIIFYYCENYGHAYIVEKLFKNYLKIGKN